MRYTESEVLDRLSKAVSDTIDFEISLIQNDGYESSENNEILRELKIVLLGSAIKSLVKQALREMQGKEML